MCYNIVAIIAYSIVKLIKINPKLKAIREENERLLTDQKIEIDQQKLINIEAAVKNNNSKLAAMDSVRPIMFLIAAVTLCKALEAQLIIFSGVFALGSVSYGVSRVFEIFKVRQIKSKVKRVKEKDLVSAEDIANDIG